VRVGIVGHEGAKFTPETRLAACKVIAELLTPTDAVCVSGRCPLGGIDVWAEVCADRWGREKLIYPPANKSWSGGYKPRNIQIAEASDVVHVILVAEYPATYTGMRFDLCYHCAKDEARALGRDHIKSGGCWTARYAQRLGKPAHWHIIPTPPLPSPVRRGGRATP
jgi:hypothetical protein